MSVSSDRFVVSRTAKTRRWKQVSNCALARHGADSANQAALGVRRILPDFSARLVCHEPGLREDAGNAHRGAGGSRGGNPQENKVAYLRPSLRWWNERFTKASGHDGSSSRHGILPITICSRIGPNRGTIRALRAPTLDPLWKPKDAEQGGTRRGTEIDLLLRNQLHSWYRLSYPALFQVRGIFRKMWEKSHYCWVAFCKNHLRQDIFHRRRIAIGIRSIPEIASRFDLAFVRPGPPISSHLH